ncbi:MAG TPA: WGR domain-containing protein [Acidisoma sp.]|jgi:predicted DNA-binding WGR domain protein|uniref:WGR domain-containing protein n=1 Tax=Acidisoma sp. TaxID=1872115 RepID=UPI002C2D0D4F|nr:WGR domain-containing protein [Acidisoma sp.]HTI01548.1 WGR domain-containing protein [Acidisoma sp.]
MALSLRRIRPERRERRFYRMEVISDLFGTVLLLRTWGRIGTDGRERREVFADRQAAAAALDRLAAAKRRRGYVEVGRTQ